MGNLGLDHRFGHAGSFTPLTLPSFAQGITGDHTFVQMEPLILEIGRIASETFPRSIQICTPQVKIIAMTDITSNGQNAFLSETRAVLSKPFTVENLLRVVHEVLSQ